MGPESKSKIFNCFETIYQQAWSTKRLLQCSSGVLSPNAAPICANSAHSQLFGHFLVRAHDSVCRFCVNDQIFGKTRQSDFLEQTPLAKPINYLLDWPGVYIPKNKQMPHWDQSSSSWGSYLVVFLNEINQGVRLSE